MPPYSPWFARRSSADMRTSSAAIASFGSAPPAASSTTRISASGRHVRRRSKRSILGPRVRCERRRRRPHRQNRWPAGQDHRRHAARLQLSERAGRVDGDGADDGRTRTSDRLRALPPTSAPTRRRLSRCRCIRRLDRYGSADACRGFYAEVARRLSGLVSIAAVGSVQRRRPNCRRRRITQLTAMIQSIRRLARLWLNSSPHPRTSSHALGTVIGVVANWFRTTERGEPSSRSSTSLTRSTRNPTCSCSFHAAVSRSVRSRVQAIGIRRAIGATTLDIASSSRRVSRASPGSDGRAESYYPRSCQGTQRRYERMPMSERIVVAP